MRTLIPDGTKTLSLLAASAPPDAAGAPSGGGGSVLPGAYNYRVRSIIISVD